MKLPLSIFFVNGLSTATLVVGSVSCLAESTTGRGSLSETKSELPSVYVTAPSAKRNRPIRSTPAAAMTARVATLPKRAATDPKRERLDGSAESGYRNGSARLGPLGIVKLQDVPYSLNVTSGQLIENTNAHTLADAVKTNPTTSLLMSPGGYTSMTRLMVRGFTAADQNEMRDGLVDRSFSYPPIENVERIEVLNGMTGFFNGFSAPGGTVNYVSKEPTAIPLASLATGFYGGGIGYVHGDFGGYSPQTDGRLGYRINLYHEDGRTSIGGSQDRTLLSGRFTYALSEDTKLWADIWHQDYSAHGLKTYFNLGTGVRVPDASKFDPAQLYGQDWTFNKAEKTLLGTGFDSKLNEVFTLRGGVRYGIMSRGYDYIGATLTDNNSTYTEKYTISPTQHETTHSEYALLDARFGVWGITQNITVGYTGTDYTYDRGADISKMLGTSNIYSPAEFADPNLTLGPTNQWQTQIFHNGVIGDRIELTESLTALIGANYAVLKQSAWGPGTAISTSNFNSAAITPSYALTYKLAPNLTTYVSYVEGLTGGDTAPSTAVNAYQVLSPSVSKQYEVGAKSTIGNLALSTALFRIERINAELDPRDKVYKHDGLEIHEGLEVVATGKLTDRLTAIGGFTLMSARVENASADPGTEGKIPVNVPEEQARLRLEYELPFASEIKVSGGANYSGRRPVDVYNTLFMAGATTFDAGIRYEPLWFNHKITVNLTIDNIFDKSYWVYYRTGDGLLLGDPRTIALTVKGTW